MERINIEINLYDIRNKCKFKEKIMIKLGDKLRDTITGFQGIATSKHEYLTGCTQYGLQATIKKDGNLPQIEYFDENRLSVVKEKQVKLDLNNQEDGCDFRERP